MLWFKLDHVSNPGTKERLHDDMQTLSDFRNTDHLASEYTGHQWIHQWMPLTEASNISAFIRVAFYVITVMSHDRHEL